MLGSQIRSYVKTNPTFNSAPNLLQTGYAVGTSTEWRAGIELRTQALQMPEHRE